MPDSQTAPHGASTAARRIGLLGGSFDPPHLAHLALGRLAQQALALDELRWLPAGAPWQKAGREMASPAHRTAMLAALLQGEPGQVIDTRELARSGPTYTIDTVRELQAEQPGADWFFVLGQDQYGRFDTWRDWPELLQRLTLAVAGRAGTAPTPPAALAAVPHRVVALPLPATSAANWLPAPAGRHLPRWWGWPWRAILTNTGPIPRATHKATEAEWTFANCNGPSSMAWKTSRPRTSWSSTPSICHRCSSG
jgi:nicotinate-nucleotide adenylyltransferase